MSAAENPLVCVPFAALGNKYRDCRQTTYANPLFLHSSNEEGRSISLICL